MHPLVRDLYKRIILCGRDYPGGLEVVRRKAKEVDPTLPDKIVKCSQDF